MNAIIRPELEPLVEDRVRSGRYASVDDVVNRAVEAMLAQESLLATDAEDLRQELAVGVEQLRRGEGRPWDVDAAKARLRAHLDSGESL